MADTEMDALRDITAAFKQAMLAEEVPSGTVARVLNRVLYGDAGGPGAIYELLPDGSNALHMGRMPALREWGPEDVAPNGRGGYDLSDDAVAEVMRMSFGEEGGAGA